MSDSKLRQLQRAAAQGDIQAEARVLLERVRTGGLALEKLELASYLGDRGAQKARFDVARPPGDPVKWVRGLEEWGTEVSARAALACARTELAHWEQERANRSRRPRIALEFAEACLISPSSEAEREALEAAWNALWASVRSREVVERPDGTMEPVITCTSSPGASIAALTSILVATRDARAAFFDSKPPLETFGVPWFRSEFYDGDLAKTLTLVAEISALRLAMAIEPDSTQRLGFAEGAVRRALTHTWREVQTAVAGELLPWALGYHDPVAQRVKEREGKGIVPGKRLEDLQRIPVKPHPFERTYDSFEEAIEGAKNHSLQGRAVEDSKRLNGTTIADGYWTQKDVVLRFSNGLHLHLFVENDLVRWTLLGQAPRLDETEVQQIGSDPVILQWGGEVGDSTLDLSRVISRRNSAEFDLLFVNECGVNLYCRDLPILSVSPIYRTDTMENMLYVFEEE